MTYKSRYPRLPVAYSPPHPELVVEEGVTQTGYFYPCNSCGQVTEFVLTHGKYRPHCCSPECRIALDGNYVPEPISEQEKVEVSGEF